LTTYFRAEDGLHPYRNTFDHFIRSLTQEQGKDELNHFMPDKFLVEDIIDVINYMDEGSQQKLLQNMIDDGYYLQQESVTDMAQLLLERRTGNSFAFMEAAVSYTLHSTVDDYEVMDQIQRVLDRARSYMNMGLPWSITTAHLSGNLESDDLVNEPFLLKMEESMFMATVDAVSEINPDGAWYVGDWDTDNNVGTLFNNEGDWSMLMEDGDYDVGVDSDGVELDLYYTKDSVVAEVTNWLDTEVTSDGFDAKESAQYLMRILRTNQIPATSSRGQTRMFDSRINKRNSINESISRLKQLAGIK